MPYSFRSAGTMAANTSGAAMTPGLPGGWQAGDLLLLCTCARGAAETVAVTGWTEIFAGTGNGSVSLFARIAVGGDTDPSVNWSGATGTCAQIAAFSGSVYTDLATLQSTTFTSVGGTTTTFPFAAYTPAHDRCIVLIMGKKSKTATSDGQTINAVSGFTEIGQSSLAGTANTFVWNYVIQTTATTVSADAWTATVAYEALGHRTITTALRAAAEAAGGIRSRLTLLGVS